MKLIPPDITKAVDLYHLPSASGTQDYPATPSETISAGLLPMDRYAHALEGGEYVDPYELYCEEDADIRVTDKAVIDEETYYVKKVFVGDFGGIAHKRASLTKDT